MIRPKKITIERVEGYAHECKRLECPSISAANHLLRAWSNTAPKGGAYDKCDFWIEFEDGTKYAGRYDLRHWQDERPDLAAHVLAFVNYLAGEAPSWMNGDPAILARYRADRAAKPEEVEQARQWLQTYDLSA